MKSIEQLLQDLKSPRLTPHAQGHLAIVDEIQRYLDEANRLKTGMESAPENLSTSIAELNTATAALLKTLEGQAKADSEALAAHAAAKAQTIRLALIKFETHLNNAKKAVGP
jgi:hypothetical protein